MDISWRELKLAFANHKSWSALNDIKVADFLSGAVSSAGGFLSAFFLVL